MTSGVVISNFCHLLQSRETHDVWNCYLSLRRWLFTQMATRYLRSYTSQVQLYQNLNMFPPPALLNALWTQLLHDRQNKAFRLRVTYIYTFIHDTWQNLAINSCERIIETSCGKTRAIKNIICLNFSFISAFVLAHCPILHQNEFWK